MKDRVQEIRELIVQLQEEEERHCNVAIELRETDQKMSFFHYRISELMKTAAEQLGRQLPVAAEIEGGKDSWFYVCGDCHGQIDTKDSFCRHCGRWITWG